MTTARTAHANCTHEATKAARSACRRGRAAILDALPRYCSGASLEAAEAIASAGDGTLYAIRASVALDRAGMIGEAADFDAWVWVASEIVECGS